VRDYWSRRPLHRPGADPDGFGDLFSLAAVDELITARMLRQPQFRLVKNAETVDADRVTHSVGMARRTLRDVADPGRIIEEFDSGSTIALQALQRYWLPLTRFCRDLELTLTHPVQANAYITPPGARGLGVHFDTHDVFVLQVAGRKHWVVHEPVIELPMPAQKHPVVADDEPLLDIVLAPGDVLYVPRGFLHAATSLDEVSAHLTIGILADTWYDVLQEVVKQAVDDVAFRAPLPIGYAFEDTGFAESVKETLERFASWVAHLEPDAISRQRRERFWDARAPILTGQFQQLARLDTITDASRVQRRPGTAMYLTTDDDRLLLHLGDRQLNMPADLDGAMRIILHRDTFTVSDLSAELDLDGRLVLIRRLIQEGALENIESLRHSHRPIGV
jgi:bifunctional lysine-specific demethylase and histidyl-hydroxylase NO66